MLGKSDISSTPLHINCIDHAYCVFICSCLTSTDTFHIFNSMFSFGELTIFSLHLNLLESTEWKSFFLFFFPPPLFGGGSFMARKTEFVVSTVEV